MSDKKVSKSRQLLPAGEFIECICYKILSGVLQVNMLQTLRDELAENWQPLTKCYRHMPIAIIYYFADISSSYYETVLVEYWLAWHGICVERKRS
jgi:hypothetical protein